jgi:signal transduction histidine kinase
MKSMEPLKGDWRSKECPATPVAGATRISSLIAENQRLRTRNKTLETVAYTLSHDLRSPLRAIEGFSTALVEDFGEMLPAGAAKNLHEIHAAVTRMQAMIAQWLGSIATGTSAGRCEAIDLSALAYSVIAELYAAEPKRIVKVFIEPGLRAYGDALLIRQLLQNLLGNAWKFTAARDDRATIAFGAIGTGESVSYCVRDNGIGFDVEDAQRIFNPFTRLARSGETEGSGVGLAIARNIIDSHGGRIWAEGQPGIGAKFCFTLPVAST